MKFFIGQKVSLLHDSGEGKVVSIIDKYHVEVDFGDDFPYDVHVDEIIPITQEEEKYFSKPTEKDELEERSAPATLGIKLIEISLAITRESGDEYRFSLLNPEAYDMLYVVFEKRKHKYQGLAYGKVDASGKDLLGIYDIEHLRGLKSLYFQLLLFKQGVMMPHAPLIATLEWKNNLLEQKFSPIQFLKQDGLLFSLRQKQMGLEAEAKPKPVFGKTKKTEERVIDLHIEELTIFPHQLSPKEMLEIQLEHFEKSLSDALISNVGKLIIIHGVGEGKLRAEIRQRLKETQHIKNYYPADHKRFGNGATEVILG